MKLTDVMAGLPLDLDHVNQGLGILSQKWPNAVENIQTEWNLDFDKWSPVVEGLKACNALPHPISDNDVEEIMANVFKINRLCGKVLGTKPLIYGRIVQLASLEALIQKGRCLSPDQAFSRLNRLKYAPFRQEEWRGVPLGNYHMWSTFHPENESFDPFDGCSASIACCRLGLSFNTPAEPCEVAILRYRLPDTVHPKLPTVADAYSGGFPKIDYFSVAAEGKPHGYTRPRTECLELGGMPECVHEVIGGEALTPTNGVTFCV